MRKIPESERIEQINAKPNIRFVRWENGFNSNRSKAICRCLIDGYEWSAQVTDLVNRGGGCPQCAGKRKWTAEERIEQINAKPNVRFVRWEGEYKNQKTKAVCRCLIDGYEWSASVHNLVNNGRACPQCAGVRKWTAEERIGQINTKPNIEFVRWEGEFNGNKSKVICRCLVDGYVFPASVNDLVNNGSGCPACATGGYNPALPGTLYALRSRCGTMVKIGISNNHEQRHRQLANRTPFEWDCIELVHGEGSRIAELEREFHARTEQAEFAEPFDGYTEWRKWDEQIPRWFDEVR